LSKRENLITVCVRFEGSLVAKSEVLRLGFGELGEPGSEAGEVEAGNLLVQGLGEEVDLLLVFARAALLVELKLGHDLVGEGAGHDKRGVSSGATKVEETSLGEDDHSVSVGPDEAVNLGLDVLPDNSLGLLNSGHVDLVIEVSNVSDNGVVLHLGHVVSHDDVLVSGGGDEDVSLTKDVLEADDRVSFHAGLEGADGVDLGDVNAGTAGAHGLGASLSDISESADNGFLSGNHDVSGAHDSVGERVAASVDVVELGLGDAVVDVDGGEEELSLLGHLDEAVDSGGGLLRDSDEVVSKGVPPVGGLFEPVFDHSEDLLELNIVSGAGIGHGLVLGIEVLGLVSLVDEEGGISTIIDDHVGSLSVGPEKGVLGAPPVFLNGLSLPGEDGSGTGSNNGGGGMVLGGEDVAGAPADIGSEVGEGLDEDGGLDGHVERSHDLDSLEGLAVSVFFPHSHQAGHLDLGELDLLAAKVGKGHILDAVVSGGHLYDGFELF